MAYTTLLNRLIDNSGLTIKEIADKCTELGEKVTPAYISTLRNDKSNRSPSPEMSRALAKACNYPYENVLCVEAYLDKAPYEFKAVLDLLREIMLTSTMTVFENTFTTEEQKQARKILKEFPMAEFICSLSQDKVKETIIKQQGAGKFKATHSAEDFKIQQTIAPTGFPISDNGMSPQIEKGDLITLEAKEIKDYKNGDIICYIKSDDKKKIYARKVIFDGESRKKITLMPINGEFMPEQLTTSKISIMGKVVTVIKAIK